MRTYSTTGPARGGSSDAVRSGTSSAVSTGLASWTSSCITKTSGVRGIASIAHRSEFAWCSHISCTSTSTCAGRAVRTRRILLAYDRATSSVTDGLPCSPSKATIARAACSCSIVRAELTASSSRCTTSFPSSLGLALLLM